MATRRLRSALRRLVGSLATRLAPIVGIQALLKVASAVGRIRHRVTGVPSDPRVLALFDGRLPPNAAHGVARSISELGVRHRALIAIVERGGLGPVLQLVNPTGVAPLAAYRASGAAIFVTWHCGPPFGLAAAIEFLHLPVFGVVRHTRRSGSVGGRLGRSGGEADAATDVLWRALRHLRSGGLVALAADGRTGPAVLPVQLLGRQLSLARGPFALARLSGAPLVPVVSYWDESGRISVDAGPAVVVDPALAKDADAFEQRAARDVAGWLEARFLRYPAQVRFRRLTAAFDAHEVTIEDPD